MKKWISVVGAMAIVVGATLAGAACGGDDNGDGGTAVATTATSKAATTPAVATSSIKVEGAWARKSAAHGDMMAGQTTMMAGDRGAAYMVIKNAGTSDDALISVQSTVASATEVHESVMNGDVVTMRPVARIDVKAGASVELKPGGYHIMFIGLKQPLQVGEKIMVTLKFEKAGAVPVEVEVRDQ